MKKKLIIYIAISIIILVVVIFSIMLTQKTNELSCSKDSDCNFYFLGYSEDVQCESCYFADDSWKCMNEQGENQWVILVEDVFGSIGNVPLCEQCYETDYEEYSCTCVQNKCLKDYKKNEN